MRIRARALARYNRRMWQYTGQTRPPWADAPGPGQESVWDYPRPPVLRPCTETVEVRAGGELLAQSARAKRVLETASPPTYYVPAEDVRWALLQQVANSSFCEWKGRASYFALAGEPATVVAWCYADPAPAFAGIHNHVSFYPARLACYVDGERVQPQPGLFYGGWITSRIAGPVKGGPGTGHW